MGALCVLIPTHTSAESAPDSRNLVPARESDRSRRQVYEGVWETTDEALLEGFATGDPEAGVVFVRRFQGKVFGLASMITGNAPDAEEAAQDAFVRAWRYAASYDPRRGSITTWLLGITRNVAIDRARMSGSRRELTLDDLPAALVADHDDPADRTGDRDEVVTLLRSLPPEQREALAAATLLGLSAREISDATEVPLGTVKTRIRRGLRRLREELRMPATL
jgi:RNA polymerase sigma-70 factor (ECF subfamily)